MNRGNKQETAISGMDILKGRYAVMTAFNWSHPFWMECNMGVLLSQSKRWQHSVKEMVRRMACVSEQESDELMAA